LITPAEEQALVAQFKTLPFREFEFHGFLGRRRVVSYGWRYDFNEGGLKPTESMPEFLLPLHQQVAIFAGRLPADFVQTLAAAYSPGATIGWHRDRSVLAMWLGFRCLPLHLPPAAQGGKHVGARLYDRSSRDRSICWRVLRERNGSTAFPRSTRSATRSLSDAKVISQGVTPHQG